MIRVRRFVPSSYNLGFATSRYEVSAFLSAVDLIIVFTHKIAVKRNVISHVNDLTWRLSHTKCSMHVSRYY